MFKYSSILPSQFDKENKACDTCGLRFEREPGFWYGAMYVSYALTTGYILVTAFLLYFLFGDPDLWVYITVIVLIIVAMIPVTFRLSHIFWLHVFGGVSYDEQASQASADSLLKP